MSLGKRIMTTLLIIVVGLVATIVVYFFILGQISKKGEAPGLTNSMLSQCSAKPNCVCSEFTDDKAHYIAPIDITGEVIDVVYENLKLVIQAQGGSLISERDDYMAFTFSSSLFGFVDDIEVRIDANNNAVHLRSASRVGYSDMGANKQRVETIKAEFLAMQKR